MPSPIDRLLLPLLIALSTVAKFETIAKGTIIFSAALFIVSPFPTARIFALISVGIVFLLARANRAWHEGRAKLEEEGEEGSESDGGDEGENAKVD